MEPDCLGSGSRLMSDTLDQPQVCAPELFIRGTAGKLQFSDRFAVIHEWKRKELMHWLPKGSRQPFVTILIEQDCHVRNFECLPDGLRDGRKYLVRSGSLLESSRQARQDGIRVIAFPVHHPVDSTLQSLPQ